MFDAVGTPASRSRSSAAIAPRQLPRRLRIRSCVASRPSIDTPACVSPRAASSRASASVMPRPPVIERRLRRRARRAPRRSRGSRRGGTPRRRSARPRARRPRRADRPPERLLGGELVRTRGAGARAAVRARVIAAQGQLPDDIRRVRSRSHHVQAAASAAIARRGHASGTPPSAGAAAFDGSWPTSAGAATFAPGARQPSTPSQF